MKKSILFSFFITISLLLSCQPDLTYKITNRENNKHEYTINTRLRNVSISFFANYSWIGNDTTKTAINIHIENGSRFEIKIDRKEMLIISRTFNYKNLMDKPIVIKPKSNRSFWLDYEAVFNPAILAKPKQMPKDEELILMPKGFKVNGKILAIEDISFVPHEKITQNIKDVKEES